jgi:hypothetical protein
MSSYTLAVCDMLNRVAIAELLSHNADQALRSLRSGIHRDKSIGGHDDELTMIHNRHEWLFLLLGSLGRSLL